MKRRMVARLARWLVVTLVAGALGAAPSAADTDVSVGGLVDIAAHGNDIDLILNQTQMADTPFDALRARVFLQGGTERTHAFLQVLIADEGWSNFRFHGGYVLHRLFETREMYVEAGKVPVHDGTWAPRTYSDKNPLVGVPLAYNYRSTLPSHQMPVDLEQLVANRGNGQSGVSYEDANGVRGMEGWPTMPLMYDNCWDYGAYFLGTRQHFDWSVGLTMGSSSAPNPGTDANNDLGMHFKLGYAVTSGLNVHLTYARGAYLADVVSQYLPAGAVVEDYMQSLWGTSVEWGWRHLTMNGEFFYNSWQTPLVADGLTSRSGYLEAKYAFLPGWYAAGRYDTMRFGDVQVAAGTVTWDSNIQRVEAGVGYHIAREFLVKAVGQLSETGNGWDLDRLLPALQLSFRY